MPATRSAATDEYLSLPGAARHGEVSYYKVLAAIARGQLRTTQVAGRVVVLRADVERWRRAKSSAPEATVRAD
jgi:hypothetical protein